MVEAIGGKRKALNTHLETIYTIKFKVMYFSTQTINLCSLPSRGIVNMERTVTAREERNICCFSFSLMQCLLARTVGMRIDETTQTFRTS